MKSRTILIWHNNGEQRFTFTVNSERLRVSRPNCNRVERLAMGGTANLWGGRGLREVSFTTFLPEERSPFYGGTDGAEVLSLLKAWQDSGDPVRLIVSGSDINDAFLIEDVTETLREGDGDITLTLTLREYKFASELAKDADGAVQSAGKTARADERVLPKTRTVKRGDTLWGIACELYGDAAATLTAVLLTAADRYFPKESLALGDAVRLLGDAGEEVFLGAVQAVSRNVETVTLIACDRGLYLTANELSGVFAGSPEGICRAVAMRLSLPVGTLEVPAGWKRLVAGAGVRAFDILRQAVGEGREISIQNGALTVTKAGQERFVIAEETVLASRGTADARQMVNRCAVIDRRGAAAATAQNTTDLARFGLRQRVLGKSGDAAAQAQGGLRGRILRGELTVRGDLRYRCGAMVELHRKEFGLDGAYPLTAVKHRWERGLFMTELTWEGEA